MLDILTEVQALPVSGKAIATLALAAIFSVMLFLIWQTPKKVAAIEAPQTLGKASARVDSFPAEVPEQVRQNTSSRVSDRRLNAREQRVQHAPRAAAVHNNVNIGDVNSNNQTGGVNAGYIGSVQQD